MAQQALRSNASSDRALPPRGDADSPWSSNPSQSLDRSAKRDAVIRAAARAFRDRGYHKTSIDDIAVGLNVSKPTVYYYVANKEQLLFECFLAGLEPLRNAIKEQRNSGTAAERLREVISRYAMAIASDFGWCMVRVEDHDLSASMTAQIKSLKSEIDQGIRRLIREGVRDGSLAPCDPKLASFAIAGALNWIAHWYRPEQTMPATEVAEAFVTFIFAGLLPR